MSAIYLDLELESAKEGQVLNLTGPEARHAGTVARLRTGEHITIGNGRGLLLESVVESVEREVLSYRIQSVEQAPQPEPQLVLVQSLAKGGRDELAIQTATELGISGIVPWQSDRSVVRWDRMKELKAVDRWQTIVREAAKQSRNPWVPEVQALVTGHALFQRFPADQCIVLDPQAEESLNDVVSKQIAAPSLYLLVGPEGGFSAQERELFVQTGVPRAKLGNLVLRSSSAGPAAMAVINMVLGRW